MKKDELKMISSISVGTTGVIGCLYIILQGSYLNYSTLIRGLSFGLSITTIFWTFFITYGWKICPLNYIFYRPNLNGTWCGILESDYVDSTTGNNVPPIQFLIVIRQSFLSIHFKSFTKDFVGVSYAETFSLKKEQGLKNVAYLYRKDTSQDFDDILREGVAELRLIESNPDRLEGKYWSNTKTNGTIKIAFASRKHIDCFEDGLKLVINE